jgi:hypothetical protein
VLTVLNSVLIVAKLVIGSAAIAFSDGNWFLIALGALLYGRAFLSLAATRGLSGSRKIVHLDLRGALLVYMALYVVAGCLALVGSVTLAGPLAVVVAIPALSFVAFWAWAFTRLLRENPQAPSGAHASSP